MQAECTKDSVVRGHHVYKDVWRPVIGELLQIFDETNNRHDKHALAVFKEGIIVGHVPREMSRIFWFFLQHDGKIECEITGQRKKGKGLEVPCVYMFKGSTQDEGVDACHIDGSTHQILAFLKALTLTINSRSSYACLDKIY